MEVPAWMKLYLHALQLAQKLGPRDQPHHHQRTATSASSAAAASRHRTRSRHSLHLACPGQRRHAIKPIKLPMPSHHQWLSTLPSLYSPTRCTTALRFPAKTVANVQAIASARAEGQPFTRATSPCRGPESTIRNIPSTPGEQDANGFGDVIDISSQHGRRWHTCIGSAPAGAWEILRIGYTDSTVVLPAARRPGPRRRHP